MNDIFVIILTLFPFILIFFIKSLPLLMSNSMIRVLYSIIRYSTSRHIIIDPPNVIKIINVIVKSAIKTAQDAGTKVFFYVNGYSFDTSLPDFNKNGRGWAIKEADGSFAYGAWGTKKLASMCFCCRGWQETVISNISYVLDTLGADGVYIDQLSVSAKICADSHHRHKQSAKKAACKMLDELRQAMSQEHADRVFLFSEWVSDLMITRLGAQLAHTLAGSILRSLKRLCHLYALFVLSCSSRQKSARDFPLHSKRSIIFFQYRNAWLCFMLTSNLKLKR